MRASSQAVGQQPDPFLDPDIEILEIGGKGPTAAGAESAGAMIHRIGRDIGPAGRTKHAHASRHVKGAGHQQHGSRCRPGAQEPGHHAAVFSRVARVRLDQEAIAINPRGGEHVGHDLGRTGTSRASG